MKSMFISLLALAAIGMIAIFWPKPGNQAKQKTAIVVYKISTPGYWYTMRAQTGARTVTMPAWKPEICKLIVFVQNGRKDTVMTVPVSDKTFNRYNLCDTIKFPQL